MAGAVSGKLGLALGGFSGGGWGEGSEAFLSRVDAGAGQVEWGSRQVTDWDNGGGDGGGMMSLGPGCRWWVVRTEPGVCGQQGELGRRVGPWSCWAGEGTVALTSDSKGL